MEFEFADRRIERKIEEVEAEIGGGGFLGSVYSLAPQLTDTDSHEVADLDLDVENTDRLEVVALVTTNAVSATTIYLSLGLREQVDFDPMNWEFVVGANDSWALPSDPDAPDPTFPILALIDMPTFGPDKPSGGYRLSVVANCPDAAGGNPVNIGISSMWVKRV